MKSLASASFGQTNETRIRYLIRSQDTCSVSNLMDELSNVLVNEDDNAAEKNDGIRVTACINGKVASFEEFDKIFFRPVTNDESGDWSHLFRNEDEEKVDETNQVYSTLNENDTTNITFSSVATPRKTTKEEFSFTFNTDPNKGPFLLAKQQKKQLSPIRPALFTSTPTRKPNSASNSAATGDNTDFLSLSIDIEQMHRELRRNKQEDGLKALEKAKEEKNDLEVIQKVEIETMKAEFEKEKSQLNKEIERQAKEAKLEKEKRDAVHQREVDELIAQFSKLNLNDKPLDENLELNEAIKKSRNLEDELKKAKKQNERLTAQLKSEREAKEKEKLENQKILAELRQNHKIEIDRITTKYEKRLKDTKNSLNEKLKISQIDINSLKDKLAESRQDYQAAAQTESTVANAEAATSSASSSQFLNQPSATAASNLSAQMSSNASVSLVTLNIQESNQKKRKRDLLHEKPTLIELKQTSKSSDVVINRLKSSITRTKKTKSASENNRVSLKSVSSEAVNSGASGSGAVGLSTAIKLSSSIASKRNRIKYRRRQSPY